MTIELRLSGVDPPAPEPKRTIYRDIVNLPDPVKLGITVRYFNYDSVTLYFQITGSGVGYTFGTVNLGALGAGANAYINLDEFASRAKPSAEKTETITLMLKAYTDSGYTNLKWTYSRPVTVVFINSADPSYTVDVLNNFDDGTVQGWAGVNETGNAAGYPTVAVATDYTLSAPYSCKMTCYWETTMEMRSRLYKSFTTPNKDIVYAIFDVRVSRSAADYAKYLQIQRDGTVLTFIGRPYDDVSTEYLPINKWMRMIIPLPKNVTLELRVVFDLRAIGLYRYDYVWLDDFKIVSK